jgi:methyl-accepting chemotaxis protein
MEEMSASVDLQVTSLTETQKTFNQLYQELDSCVTTVHSIDTMTTEIEHQRRSVTEALDTLNRLAQDNATVTQETAAMSCELSQAVTDSGAIINDLENKVDGLVENVNKFTL